MNAHCPTKQDLLEQTEAVLSRISELSSLQLKAVHEQDHAKMMSFDKELENRVGEKERLFGALRQHRNDHGC